MITIGFVALERTYQTALSEINGKWKLVQLARKGPRSISSELKIKAKKLDAIAIVGSHSAKARYAREALEQGKHVMIDLPAGQTSQEIRHLNELAGRKDLRLYSPNLLKTEPGMDELKRTAEDTSSNLLSLTMSYKFAAKGRGSISMKLAQLIDLVEWIAGSKCKEAWAQGSTQTATAAAHVILVSHENGVKTLLNLSSNSTSDVSRFWADCIFENALVHLNPGAQSVLVERFAGSSVTRINWAVHALEIALLNFRRLIDGGAEDLRYDDMERVLALTRQLI